MSSIYYNYGCSIFKGKIHSSLSFLPKVSSFLKGLIIKYKAEARMEMVIRVDRPMITFHFLVLTQAGKEPFG